MVRSILHKLMTILMLLTDEFAGLTESIVCMFVPSYKISHTQILLNLHAITAFADPMPSSDRLLRH